MEPGDTPAERHKLTGAGRFAGVSGRRGASSLMSPRGGPAERPREAGAQGASGEPG